MERSITKKLRPLPDCSGKRDEAVTISAPRYHPVSACTRADGAQTP